jgi:hypothetical protein
MKFPAPLLLATMAPRMLHAFSTTLRRTTVSRLRVGMPELIHDTSNDEFTVAVLGDLHLDPRKMEDYVTGRNHWLPILTKAAATTKNACLVSLGDLGESKSVRPEETSELFAGTTECHQLAAEYLSSFGVPYDVVGGNHGTFIDRQACMGAFTSSQSTASQTTCTHTHRPRGY